PPPPMDEAPPPPPMDEAPPPPPMDEAPPPPPMDEAPPLPPMDEAPPPPPEAFPEAKGEAPTLEAEDEWGTVVAIDDDDAQFELGREAQLVQVGWMVNGTVVCGNHTKADLILPENRLVEGQEFLAMDYFLLQVRGRRGFVEILEHTEVLVDGDEPEEDRFDQIRDFEIEVIRRDDRGEEDFNIRLDITEDRSLPDPRARLVRIDNEDPLVAALITKGLPKGAERVIRCGKMEITLFYDGDGVTISNYLDTYRHGEGFKPFFVQRGKKRFKTAPEDGVDIELQVGDRLVIGNAVYLLKEE
ncbi:MAG: hypothetical protein HN348_21710, partial [Proteobacteria bacterium]|nr:hypothetical protein [Pseudomonadota bacterium]